MMLKVILWLSIFCSPAQVIKTPDIPKGIIETFETGNSSLLTPYLNEEMSMIILNSEFRGQKDKALKNLDKFFVNHKIVSFEVKHSSIRTESGFFIGSLQSKDSRFRVNCFFKKGTKHIVINQIRIDNAKD